MQKTTHPSAGVVHSARALAPLGHGEHVMVFGREGEGHVARVEFHHDVAPERNPKGKIQHFFISYDGRIDNQNLTFVRFSNSFIGVFIILFENLAINHRKAAQ